MLSSVIKKLVANSLFFLVIILKPLLSLLCSGAILPEFEVGLLFFFTIFVNNSFSNLILVIFGLMQDFINNNPLGVNAMFYLIIKLLLTSVSKFLRDQRFNILWFVFILILLTATLAKCLLLTLIKGTGIVNITIIWQALLTIFAYPIVHYLCLRKAIIAY